MEIIYSKEVNENLKNMLPTLTREEQRSRAVYANFKAIFFLSSGSGLHVLNSRHSWAHCLRVVVIVISDQKRKADEISVVKKEKSYSDNWLETLYTCHSFGGLDQFTLTYIRIFSQYQLCLFRYIFFQRTAEWIKQLNDQGRKWLYKGLLAFFVTLPLSIVSDPFVSNPFLAKQNRTCRMVGVFIRSSASQKIVPK